MKAIVCYDKKTKGIGCSGKLLFDIKEDLEYFKGITAGKIVVMGNITYQSLPLKPLPNRINIVITKYPEMSQSANGEIYMHLPTFLKMIENMDNTDNIFVIGGGQIYKALLDKCDYIYATEVYTNKRLEPDAYFPDLDKLHWKKSSNTFLCNNNGDQVFTTLYTRIYPKILHIPRATKPGEVNVNGYKYDIESYNAAYEDFVNRFKFFEKPYTDFFKLSVPCEVLYGNDTYNSWPPSRYNIIDPVNSYGVRIVDITDDECTLLFTDDRLYEKVKEYKDKNQAVMLMRYIAVTHPDTSDSYKYTAKIEKINAFDLNIGNTRLYSKVQENR